MKKFLVSFATDNMKNSQKRLEDSAYKYGFDGVFNFGPLDVSPDFVIKNNSILHDFLCRGAGYWLWKPYVILKALSLINDGDILMYSDVGNEIIGDVTPLINYTLNNDIMFFRVHGLSIRKFTKNYMLNVLNMFPYADNDIANAAFSLYKKNNFSLSIVNDWLYHCQIRELITDDSMGMYPHPEFIDHRHDQSILSFIIHKYNLDMNKDPSQFGVLASKDGDFYNQIFNHDRWKA